MVFILADGLVVSVEYLLLLYKDDAVDNDLVSTWYYSSIHVFMVLLLLHLPNQNNEHNLLYSVPHFPLKRIRR